MGRIKAALVKRATRVRAAVVRRGLACTCTTVLALCAQLAAQRSNALLDDEGPLDNGAFLPLAIEATEHLARGDRSYAELVARTPFDAGARGWGETFDAWRAALNASSVGAVVPARSRERAGEAAAPWPDPDGTASASVGRRADGVEYAVLRRLIALEPRARAEWTRRFAEVATAALAQAVEAADFARVERAFPATEAAARAALVVCEIEFERAHALAARAWWERALRHTQLADLAGSPVAVALERRAPLFVGERAADEAWMSTGDMAPTNAVLIDHSQIAAGSTSRALLAPGVGVRPGLAFLSGQRVAVHVPDPQRASTGPSGEERVTLVDLTSGRRISTFEPRKLEALAATGWGGATQYRPSQAPGWPLLIASDGTALVLVVGRHGRDEGNTLMCVDIERGEQVDLPPLPELRWALHDGQRCARTGRVTPLSDWPDARLEFQPGALIRDGTVFVLAREFAPGDADAPSVEQLPDAQAEIRTWICAFDLFDGDLRWRTDIGKGVEIQRDVARMQGSSLGTAAAQPLVELDGRLFAGTHTGLGALVDAADGRVAWTLRNQRRGSASSGWSGARPPFERERRCIVWAPADSQRVYWLRAEPDLDGRGVFARPPRALDSAVTLIGGDATSATVLAQRGDERTLVEWNAATGGYSSSPALSPDEYFSGEGLASAQRSLFATNRGLYLLDRTAGSRLIDFTALKLESPAQATLGLPGGSVWAQGRYVCVLGLSTLWIFEAK